jgi:antitoxin component YwqK of YwqJK toxin-antitoxin module
MMKKTIIISVFILICIIGFSQENSNLLTDGYHTFKYPNGSVSSEGMIKKGRPEGFWTSYYITGIKKSEGKRTNFLLDSIWIFYDQTGDTTEKINYLLGKKNGFYYKYKKEPGKGVYVWSKELFAGDKKEGLAYVYFPDGKIQQTISYNEGRKEGLSKEFDKDGNIITLLEYNNDFLITRERINRIDNKGLKQGEWKEFYPNGSIKSERTFKEDLMHGYYKEYDSRGKLVMTMLYENGSIVKSEVEDEPDIEIENKYNDAGKLVYSGPFRNKVPVGIHRQFGDDGKVINSFVYNDNGLLISEGIVDEAGNRNGKWKDFYPDGKVQAEGQYTDNRRSGIWKFFNLAQKLEQTGGYNSGRPDGVWRWYYENGAILREEEYFQGVRDGLCTEYSETGEVIANGQYSDNERNGEWKYKTGDYNEEGNYIVGLMDGVWKAYYSNGKLKFKGSFIQGNPDGLQIYYYENGKVKEEQYYKMGIRTKTWKKFDEEGVQILVITYKDDTEMSINGVKIKLPESDVRLIQ